jgi:hypothetical protein
MRVKCILFYLYIKFLLIHFKIEDERKKKVLPVQEACCFATCTDMFLAAFCRKHINEIVKNCLMTPLGETGEAAVGSQIVPTV